MMPPATACAMRIRLRGKRSLTLFAHSAAAAAAEHADDHPAIDAGQRRPFEMYQLVIAHCSLGRPAAAAATTPAGDSPVTAQKVPVMPK